MAEVTTKIRSQLDVVVPVWRDDDALDDLLNQLSRWELRVWVVDGEGSADTKALVADRGHYLATPPSRGGQIAAGISASDAPWVWVIHADTFIEDAAFDYVAHLVEADDPCWGRFDVSLKGLSLVAYLMNRRSRWSRICTGDQAMFFHRSLLDAIHGYPDQPLMEDIEVSKLLKRQARDQFRAPDITVAASPRRWREYGVVRTVINMWRYRWLYFRGRSAADLYQLYYGK